MKKLRFIFIFLFFVEFVFAAGRVSDSDYGLAIQSSPVPDVEKTSLVLENNSPVELGKETTLSFRLFVRKEYMFGIVLRIVTNRNKNIDLMLTITDTTRHPILVVDEFAYPVRQPIVTGEWIPVGITFLKAKGEIVLDYAGETVRVPHELSRTSDVRISFGTSSFKSFESTDIASVNIRDVKIFSDGALKRYWKLKEHRQNLVLDSVARVPAVAVNPEWLIDIHSTWEKIYSDKVPFNTQIAFDPKGLFYIIPPDSKSIRVFDTHTGSEQLIQVGNGFIVSTSPNSVFFDASANQIVSYNIRDASVSRYSFDSNAWSSLSGSKTDPFLNNSAVYHPSDNILYSFGGYEYHKYNHTLVKMSASSGSEKSAELIDIHPRFSASTAIVGNTMYIFGGRGSKTGKQEIVPRNYYDFYSVDLQMNQTLKLWELDSITDDFLPGENMVYDGERKCFYVFTTKGGGSLIKIEPDKKGFELMSFPVGEDIGALYLYTNLYYDASQEKLFALIYQQKTQTETTVSIYSLDYPPVPIQNLSQVLAPADKYFRFTPWWWLIIAIAVGGTVLFWRSGKLRRTKDLKDVEGMRNAMKEEVFEKTKGKGEVAGLRYYDFSKSSICLLNNFKVFDTESNNITELLSPTLRNLLILLVLNTEKDDKGLSGNKMVQLLWPNKNEESAKNIRYVYLSKLRSIIEKTGEVEIRNKNGFWTIYLGNNVLCDYTEAMRLFISLKTNDFEDHEQTGRLLELLLRGVLLPDMEIDWLDNFKSDFSNLTVDVLTKLAYKEGYFLNDELRLRIADTLFLHDLINEDALYIKSSILFQSGKKGIAKSVYDNFCKEYRNLLGIDYKYSLAEVLARK
jgi:DNA-binding SARP family transcriptional activator